jgi:2-polyprenyl-3-methyl-5-hydroxy-6-metoxy-1,4-benzoquinol methylase
VHVLAKFIELCGYIVCDKGCGIGCVGLIAAALGASVTLSNQNNVGVLIAHNIKLCTSSHMLGRDNRAL